MPQIAAETAKWLRFHYVRVLVIGLNGLFWSWFWYEAARNAVPYSDRPPAYEELSPGYKFGDTALPWDSDVRLPAFRVLHWSQKPALFVGARSIGLVERDWSARLGPLSTGAWVLVGTMLLSFLQWWLVGSAIDYALSRATRKARDRPK